MFEKTFISLLLMKSNFLLQLFSTGITMMEVEHSKEDEPSSVTIKILMQGKVMVMTFFILYHF